MAFNRLDPEYLSEWRKDCHQTCESYLRGHITLLQAIECFQNLGFKDDALKAEWLSLEREKNKASNAA